MSQVVSSKPYCIENSNQLTRTSSDSFFHIDGSNQPTIVDKNQSKRLYRLQKKPYVNTRLHLDKSDVADEKQGYFENILQKQVNESVNQPIRVVYHKPTDMSDESMARFSLGKSRPDPQRLIPTEMTTLRNHPLAPPSLRQEPILYTDRAVSDRVVRARVGPGGVLNPGEDFEEIKQYLRSTRPNGRIQTRKQATTDELARHYMYTSVTQASFDEIAWDVKLPKKQPVPPTTYERNSNPFFESRSLPAFFDVRSHDALEWDRNQPRHALYYRKPIPNIAPLPRAQQISGYSGSIGGDNLQDIDNPTIDFKPYTVVRNEQPKSSIDSFNPNMSSYTGKTHWAKIEPISHYDETGRAYTTTAAVHKSLPLDLSPREHRGLHGHLSRAVTTVYPQNPFNQLDKLNTTINGSLDSRPHVILRELPPKHLPSPRQTEPVITENE